VTENGDGITGASCVGAAGFFTVGVAATDSFGAAMAELLKVGGLDCGAGFVAGAGLGATAAVVEVTVRVGRGAAAGAGTARGTNLTGEGFMTGVAVDITGAGLVRGTHVGTWG
jgi:hypothetical protein